ncbi:MAG: hypothetical protein MUE49_00010 [Rhodospirillales bacterium]|jgi:hypothetical protein|nr:hypothetical protein [Rhodospirillales bacterium]
MTAGPAMFRWLATLTAGNLAEAARTVFAALGQSAAIAVPVGWRGDDDRMHDAASPPPDDLAACEIAFADANCSAVIVTGDGVSTLDLRLLTDAMGAGEQRRILAQLAGLCGAMIAAGGLTACNVTRQHGGRCLPYLPLVGDASHIIACTEEQLDWGYADRGAFLAAWDHVESHNGLRLCSRAMTAIANPDFLAHVLNGHMAMARAARPGRVRFLRPEFEPGEFDILDRGEPTLIGTGYFADSQVYEFAGHTPPGTELRCLDLILARKIVADGSVPGGGPVREVRAVFMDEAQASRSGPLLQDAGIAVYWEDREGRLQRLASGVPPPA